MNKKYQPDKIIKRPEAGNIPESKFIPKNSNTLLTWVLLGVIVLVTYITFYPALKNNFTNWDDHLYVVQNPSLAKPIPEGAIYFFHQNYFAFNYHPLTMIVYSLEYHIAKLNPHFYHSVNIFIHLVNVILVFFFIWLLSGKKTEVAAIVSLLFGIHPMHVESVAWISELKDVLYTFFFIGALIIYYKYIKKEKKSIGLLLFTLFLFILSCLSKPAAITFPLSLLLLDFYTERKIKPVVWIEKIPFFLTSILFGILTLQAQEHAISKSATLNFFQKFCIGCYSMLHYIVRFFLPAGLTSVNPYPILTNGFLPALFYVAPIIAVIVFYFIYRTLKYTRLIIFGFLFFFLNIALVLNLITVGFSITYDRYTYVPYIGLFFIVAMGFSWLYHNRIKNISTYRSLALIALIIITCTFSYLSDERCKVWYNCETLWTDVINKYPELPTAYKYRGAYYIDKKVYDFNPGKDDNDKGLSDFNTYLRMKTGEPIIYFMRGNILKDKQRFTEAIDDYTSTIKLDPLFNNAYLNRGIVYAMLNKYDSAFSDFNKAILLVNNNPVLYSYRANIYCLWGKFSEGLADYSKAIKLDSANAGIYSNRATAFYNMKDYESAIKDNEKAIKINPGFLKAYMQRSKCYYSLKNYKNALADALQVQRMGYQVDKKYLDELKSYIK